jgi:hypothetical protein
LNELFNRFKKDLSDLQKRVRDLYIERIATNQDVDLDKLLSELNKKKDELVQLTRFDNYRVSDGEVIEARELNTMFSALYTDIYSLYGAGYLVSQIHDKYKLLSEEKVGDIRSAIKTEELRLRSITFLNSKPEYSEAFYLDLQDNNYYGNKHAVYSPFINGLTSATLSSEDVEQQADLSVEFLGNPEIKSMPNYDLTQVFDRAKTTAWYNLLAFKSNPEFVIGPEYETLIVTRKSDLTGVPYDNNKKIPCNVSGLIAGQDITIGDIKSYRVEESKIKSVGEDFIELFSPLRNNHYANEPIYSGVNLVQTYGAIADLQIKFKYPQKVNFFRLTPFSSSPLRVLGIYVDGLQSGGRLWTKLDIAPFQLNDTETISLERVICSSVRVILEQRSFEVATMGISSSEEVKDVIWSRIYEEESGKKLFKLNEGLKKYVEEDIIDANTNNRRGFLFRKNLLDMAMKQYYRTTASTDDSAEQEMQVLQDFVSGNSGSESSTSRVVNIYEVGLAELEIFNNLYRPTSHFMSRVITPKRDNPTVSVFAEESVDERTSVVHNIRIQTGEDIAIPNRNSVDSSGRVVSKNELLDVNFDTGAASLRFEPLGSTVQVEYYGSDTDSKKTITLNVTNQQVYIPSGILNQKMIYQATYPVKYPDVDVATNIETVVYSRNFDGTNDGEFLELPNSPVIEPGIVNDVIRWRKPNRLYAKWLIVLNPSYTMEGTLPSDCLIVGNIYYGRAITSPIVRDNATETFVRSVISRYAGDVNLWVDRFFQKYQGQVLEQNLVYEPIEVVISGQKCLNLTHYDGSPDSSFISSVKKSLQFRHDGNRFLFGEVIPTGTSISVKYRFRESTIRYNAELRVNKKSNFYRSPVLKDVMIATAV